MSDRNLNRPQVPGHRVEALLGRGASGTVWQGRDAMGRAVAIKVPHEAGWLADEDASRTEAHVLLAVRHEHLVTLRDVVPMGDGRVALVFDLVTGASVRSTVAARGQLRPGEVVTVVTPLCEALEALHGAGGLHGDVSPSNVMLTAVGKPLLLDLGAARLAGIPSDAPVHGTPGFVAPEVRQGLAPTEASDVFSVGALAWFCLTGNGAPDTMLRLDPEVIRSHVGPELADVIGACIDPDPARRPSSPEVARLFYDTVPAEAVEVVIGADEASALTHRLRAEARDEAATPAEATRGWRQRWQTAAAWHRSRPPGRRLRGWRPTRAAALLGVLLTLVVVVLGVGVVSARSTASANEPAEPGAPGGPDRPLMLSSPTASATAASIVATTTVPTSASGAAPTAVPPVPPTAAAAEALVRRTDAPRTAPQELMQALSDRRGLALTTRDVAQLARFDQPASPAHTADAALIERLRTDGTHWEGLSLEVARATFVSAEGTRAVVRARVDWTAYVVVTEGQRVERPAATGEVLDFTLVSGAQGWRLGAVCAPAT